jgi:hypothetical protein
MGRAITVWRLQARRAARSKAFDAVKVKNEDDAVKVNGETYDFLI